MKPYYSRSFILIICFSFNNFLFAQHLKKWQIFELTFTSEKTTKNPYVAGLPGSGERQLTVEFIGKDGEAKGKIYTINAFWDGGKNWKARFAPPYAGSWEYSTHTPDKGIRNKKGILIVDEWTEEQKENNPGRRGFIYVADTGRRAGRYFIHADGTPFLWIADTWWNWTDSRIYFSTFKKMVDDRASKGFTIGQLFVPGNGWGRQSSLLDSSYNFLDIPHMQKVDSMIAYANSKGITVWVHGWWSRADIDKTIGEEKMRRWWRYLIDRLGAYNVIWVGAGEYNNENYGGFKLDFWKNLGAMIKNEDPYKRIVSFHPTPPSWSGGFEAPQWSTAEVLHAEPWLDYNQSQVGHSKSANERIPAVVHDAYEKNPPKPIVTTEPWYEFIDGSADAKDIRFGAWSAFLSGAAGHTYGGGHTWLAYEPESLTDNGPWPLDKSFEINTLDYPGAISMGTMAKILGKLPWWLLEPRNEIVKEYAEPFCSAIPGQLYLIYLRYGGGFKIDLDDQPNVQFRYDWIDPLTGKSLKSGKISGGKISFLSSPRNYPTFLTNEDILVIVKRIEN